VTCTGHDQRLYFQTFWFLLYPLKLLLTAELRQLFRLHAVLYLNQRSIHYGLRFIEVQSEVFWDKGDALVNVGTRCSGED